MSLEALIAEIRAAHRERVFAMEQRKRANLALLAFLRTQAGWRLDLPEKERKAIADRAKAFAEGKDDESLNQYRAVVDAAIAARKPFDEVEGAAVKEMEKLAVQLPVWEIFGKDVRGFGAASLAVIVGEAGDLSIYRNPAKLWKRMGVAVVDGIRQGGLAKNASKDDWIEHGYSPMRRSRLWNIGDAIIKSNRDGAYRTLYLQRKEYEIQRNPEMTPMQAHRRAQRFMEKRLLKHLWQVWRGGKPDDGWHRDEPDQQAETGSAPKVRMPAAQGASPGALPNGYPSPGANSFRQTKDRASPKARASAKRPSTVLVQPDQGMTGVPIQQAGQVLIPTQGVPSDARGRIAAPRTLSRQKRDGGHRPSATHGTRAAQ